MYSHNTEVEAEVLVEQLQVVVRAESDWQVPCVGPVCRSTASRQHAEGGGSDRRSPERWGDRRTVRLCSGLQTCVCVCVWWRGS